jgi:uncharacterized protein (TIGR03435 family)
MAGSFRFGGRQMVFAAAMTMAMPCVLSAQGGSSFEVSTVKPSDTSKPGHSLMMSKDKFETQAQTVRAMILFAYGLNAGSDQQVTGGPAWIGTAQWDVEAKEDPETVEKLTKLSQEDRVEAVRHMVQQLLADRFKLKVHHEMKELPVYSMTVAKGGVKMTPTPPEPPLPPNEDGTPRKPRGSGIRMSGKGELEGINAGPSILASVLGRQPEIGGRMVLDKTGLTGRYDFKLKWVSDAGMNGADSGAASDSLGVSLFTAMQEQLGLKLEATKDSVDTIVIDSAEMPTEN